MKEKRKTVSRDLRISAECGRGKKKRKKDKKGGTISLEKRKRDGHDDRGRGGKETLIPIIQERKRGGSLIGEVTPKKRSGAW